MKAFSSTLVLLLMGGSCLCSEERTTQLTRAAQLNSEGNFGAALELVAPLADAAHAESATPGEGIAWNIRGVALQNLGDIAQARRSYEAAIRALRRAPGFEEQYAAVLDNLGSLEADALHFAESRSLRLRAERIYSAAGNRAGVARVLENLALIAIGERDWKEARRDLADALDVERHLAKPDEEDLAALHMAQCLEQEHEGNDRAALTEVGKAIELWLAGHGAKYYLLSTGYSLRAAVEQRLHDNAGAIADLELSLKLMEEDRLNGTRAYALTQRAYGRALREAGRPQEAARADAAAQVLMQGADYRRCRDCTISLESLR